MTTTSTHVAAQPAASSVPGADQDARRLHQALVERLVQDRESFERQFAGAIDQVLSAVAGSRSCPECGRARSIEATSPMVRELLHAGARRLWLIRAAIGTPQDTDHCLPHPLCPVDRVERVFWGMDLVERSGRTSALIELAGRVRTLCRGCGASDSEQETPIHEH